VLLRLGLLALEVEEHARRMDWLARSTPAWLDARHKSQISTCFSLSKHCTNIFASVEELAAPDLRNLHFITSFYIYTDACFIYILISYDVQAFKNSPALFAPNAASFSNPTACPIKIISCTAPFSIPSSTLFPEIALNSSNVFTSS
jgi:hypothetical protein